MKTKRAINKYEAEASTPAEIRVLTPPLSGDPWEGGLSGERLFQNPNCLEDVARRGEGGGELLKQSANSVPRLLGPPRELKKL